MKGKLTILLNTLAQIETHGDGTLKMAGCLQHAQRMIDKCDMQEKSEEAKRELKRENNKQG